MCAFVKKHVFTIGHNISKPAQCETELLHSIFIFQPFYDAKKNMLTEMSHSSRVLVKSPVDDHCSAVSVPVNHSFQLEIYTYVVLRIACVLRLKLLNSLFLLTKTYPGTLFSLIASKTQHLLLEKKRPTAFNRLYVSTNTTTQFSQKSSYVLKKRVTVNCV